MSPLDALRVSVRAIAANGLRSFLTALGMIIGVGSVIALIAVGQGSQKGVQDRIRSLGSNLLFVQPAAQVGAGGVRGQAGAGITLTAADAAALSAAGIGEIVGVAPQLSVAAQVISSVANEQVQVIGTTPSYAEVRGARVAAGTFLTDADEAQRTLNVVLGSAVAATLFPDEEAVGQTVRLTTGGNRINLTFRVIGVLAPRGGSSGGQQDNYVVVPLSTASGRLSVQRTAAGAITVNQINIQTSANADQARVKAEVTDVLLVEHNVTEPNFTLQSQEDLLGATTEVTRTLSILLGSIAGISLVVGGIGVMNIMLVSVTERTREIGIRRAVGARRQDIVVQFLTEALVLCVAGGVIGIAAGVFLSLAFDGRTVAGQQLNMLVQPWSVAVAFGVAAAIGAISGTYPAVRASRLDPIDALRSE